MVAASPTSVMLEVDGVRTTYDVAVTGDAVDVDWPGGHAALRAYAAVRRPGRRGGERQPAGADARHRRQGRGRAGPEVEAGQPVLVLEAMKMQHTVRAPGAGTVTEIDVKPGAQVAAGEVLAVVEGRRRRQT